MFRTVGLALGVCAASLVLLVLVAPHENRMPPLKPPARTGPKAQHADAKPPVSRPSETHPVAQPSQARCRIHGVVVGPDGKPLEDIHVRAEPAECEITKTPSVDGELEVLAPPGKVSLFVRAAGYALTKQTIDVGAGADARVQVRLGEDKGVLEGRVSDGSGHGVPGASIECWTAPDEPGEGSSIVVGSASTDAEGRYSIRGLSEGEELQVRVHAKEAPTVVRGPVKVSAKHVDFVVGEVSYASLDGGVKTDDPSLVNLAWELRLFHVADDGSWQLVGEFAPGRPSASDTPRFAAAQGGKFELHDLLPGAYVLVGKAEGFAPAEVGPLSLPAGASLSGVTLSFGKGRSIFGVVRGTTTGQPIAGVAVTIEGSGVVLARTGADGGFQVTHLGPGHYVLRATHEAYRDAQAEVDVPADVDVNGVRLSMDDSPALLGKVTDAQGKPVPSGKVTAIREGERREADVKDGTYLIHGLAGGTYRLWAHAPGYGQLLLPNVAVSTNGRTVRDLCLSKGGAICLTIQANGRGVEGVKATLRWKDGMEVQPIAFSGSDGKPCECSGADGVLRIEQAPTAPLVLTLARGDTTRTLDVSVLDGTTLNLPVDWIAK